MEHIGWAVFLTDLLIRVALSVRVVMCRLPVGTSLAWLTVILIFPIGGAVLYLLVGEYRLGRKGALRKATLRGISRCQPSVLHPIHSTDSTLSDPQSGSVASGGVRARGPRAAWKPSGVAGQCGRGLPGAHRRRRSVSPLLPFRVLHLERRGKSGRCRCRPDPRRVARRGLPAFARRRGQRRVLAKQPCRGPAETRRADSGRPPGRPGSRAHGPA